MAPESAAHELLSRIRTGDRRALAQAITLVESEREDHRRLAADMMRALLGTEAVGARVAITGPPGAGKSTLINALGVDLLQSGKRVAVLAVDPSSGRSGGSLLADKTRMVELAASPNAFVRPSPASGVLGGVARHTRESILLCEAGAYDPVLVETVGVGQSEVGVARLVDTVVVVALAGAGDEVQGIKRGIIEAGDVFLVNKADGDNRERAESAARDLKSALSLLRPKLKGWEPPVLLCSATGCIGIGEAWQAILRHRAHVDAAVGLERVRAAQRRAWFLEQVEQEVVRRFLFEPSVHAKLERLGDDVERGQIDIGTAIDRVLEATGVRA